MTTIERKRDLERGSVPSRAAHFLEESSTLDGCESMSRPAWIHTVGPDTAGARHESSWKASRIFTHGQHTVFRAGFSQPTFLGGGKMAWRVLAVHLMLPHTEDGGGGGEGGWTRGGVWEVEKLMDPCPSQ